MMAIGDLAKRIQESSDARLREWLREVDPTSPAWSGIIAELEYRASREMRRQTRALVWLTWVIAALTFALLLYTLQLDKNARAHEKSKAFQQNASVKQVSPNPTTNP
jgi:hypothetical protein